MALIRHSPRPYAPRPASISFDLFGRVNWSAVLRAVGKFLQQGKVRAIRIEPGDEPFVSADAKLRLNIRSLLEPSRPDPFVKVIKRQDAI